MRPCGSRRGSEPRRSNSCGASSTSPAGRGDAAGFDVVDASFSVRALPGCGTALFGTFCYLMQLRAAAADPVPILVAAAGNNCTTLASPATSTGATVVSALDLAGALAPYSRSLSVGPGSCSARLRAGRRTIRSDTSPTTTPSTGLGDGDGPLVDLRPQGPAEGGEGDGLDAGEQAHRARATGIALVPLHVENDDHHQVRRDRQERRDDRHPARNRRRRVSGGGGVGRALSFSS